MLNKKELIKFIVRQIIKALVILVLVLILIYFLKTEIVEKRQAIAKERQTIFALSERENITRELAGQLDRYDNTITQIKEAIISVNQIDNFVGQVDSLSRKYNLKQALKISGIQDGKRGSDTDANASTSTYRKVEFSLTLEGNANNLVGALIELESLPYFLSLTQINIDNKVNDWPENSTAQVKGFIFINLES